MLMEGVDDIGVVMSSSPRIKENSSSPPTKSPRTPKVDASKKTKSPRTKSSSERPPAPRLRPQSSLSSSSSESRPSPRSVILTCRKPNTSLSSVPETTTTTTTSESSSNAGHHLLRQARDLVSSGENPRRALHLALRAARSFEKSSNGKPDLDLVMSLHVAATIYCILGQYEEAIPVLERSIEVPSLDRGGLPHYLAKFSGYMQLGDTFAMLGQLERSIRCYAKGLELQKQALGDKDPRVGDTCRYLAEAHMQALQYDEAERWCLMALDIHRDHGGGGAGGFSLEETADRRLLGLICDTKGDHGMALEHLVLASMAMMSNGQEAEVASVDCSIGDSYLWLAQYDQAVFAYQKALATFKSTRGENHPSVASVLVRLADLYNKTGKLRESKSYCENALRIYRKHHHSCTAALDLLLPLPGGSTPSSSSSSSSSPPPPPLPLPEEIASGLTEMSAIYESMDEPDEALRLLRTALNAYRDVPGQQCTAGAIEAQMGALYYITGKYVESYGSLKSALEKLRACGGDLQEEKRRSAGGGGGSLLIGSVLNQMGLACVQCDEIEAAAELFEEARDVFLEEEYGGSYHPHTLRVYSNLAATYDAMGRLKEAVAILEHVVGVREEKLGTANPDVDDEKRRLSVLLKESGRVRHAKSRSLQELLLET